MKLARVIGTVTATAKDAKMGGLPLLICDIVDGKGKVIETSIVAVDSVGAGPGDQVLISFGSAARLPVQTTGAPIDALITAIIDTVALT